MKFSGIVGFVRTEETKPSVWEEITTPRHYIGDVVKNTRRVYANDQVIAGLVVNNNISIIADKYMRDNLSFIRFVEFEGSKWSVTNIDISYPRIILTLGDIYNAKEE